MRPYSVVPVRPAMPVHPVMREQVASPFGLSPVRAVTPFGPSPVRPARCWLLVL